MLNNFKKLSKNLSITREVFCLCLFVISTIGFGQANLKFKDGKKSFGFVKKGEVVKLEFAFTNTGNQPLLITDAKVECECTIVEYPKQPILPNQLGIVTISFDTKSVYDRQDRTVVILSNAKNGNQKIRFKGIVLK